MVSPLLLHASCVAVGGAGVLLLGPSGIGKSDVALRLIAEGAVLVSDDQTALTLSGEGIPLASPPAELAGMIELRHVGIMKNRPFLKEVPVALVVTLASEGEALERLPCSAAYSLLDRPVRWLKLPARDASTPAKIRFALEGAFVDADEKG